MEDRELKKRYLWLPHKNYYTMPPLTDDIVKAAEAVLGKKLPESYLDILRIQNGGYIRYDCHPAPVGYRWKFIQFDHIMGIGSFMDSGGGSGILESHDFITEWQMPADIILLAGDGHWWVALDYRTCGPEGEPEIAYIDNDLYQVFPLARDFAALLDGLVVGDYHDVIGFVSVGSAWEKLLADLSRYLRTTLRLGVYHDRPEWYAGDHPEWRSSLQSNQRSRLRFFPNQTSSQLLEYPMYPQCDWLFAYEVKDRQLADKIFDDIRQLSEHEVIKIHTPICLENYD